jgi:alpha-mannosidase
VTLRLVETKGRATAVAITSEVGTLRAIRPADLLEQRVAARAHQSPVELHGYQVATVLAQLEVSALVNGTDALGPDAEVAQPLHARYWLHNRGPAPLGGLPAVAHLHPAALTAEPGSEVVLRLTAASDCTDTALTGAVRLHCPDGWSATPAELPFTLDSGAHQEADVVLAVPAHVQPGRYPVRAQLRLTGDAVPAAWRQAVEDVCIVTVGDGVDEDALVYLVDEPSDIELAAGDSGRLTVTVGTHARADLSLEAHLISPWGTWEWIGPDALGAVLPAGGAVELGFDVSPPVGLTPGQWWALVRVGCAGRLVYSPAVRVTVT